MIKFTIKLNILNNLALKEKSVNLMPFVDQTHLFQLTQGTFRSSTFGYTVITANTAKSSLSKNFNSDTNATAIS